MLNWLAKSTLILDAVSLDGNRQFQVRFQRTVCLTSASVATFTMAIGEGAPYSLHRGKLSPSVILAPGDNTL